MQQRIKGGLIDAGAEDKDVNRLEDGAAEDEQTQSRRRRRFR
jgi:hypothetical protein